MFGLLAGTEKRQGAVLYAISCSSDVSEVSGDRLESRRLLERARDHYWQTFLLDRTSSWAIVQYLSLELVLRHWKRPKGAGATPRQAEAAAELRERDPADLWRIALTLAIQDLSDKEASNVEWALGNLIELYVLALFPQLRDVAKPADAKQRASSYARELVTKAGADSFAVYSTRRQMLRYVEWYAGVAELSVVAGLAETVCEVLPETENEDWN
jgi:hypothetical protein